VEDATTVVAGTRTRLSATRAEYAGATGRRQKQTEAIFRGMKPKMPIEGGKAQGGRC
jgi:hypothetical protein